MIVITWLIALLTALSTHLGGITYNYHIDSNPYLKDYWATPIIKAHKLPFGCFSNFARVLEMGEGNEIKPDRDITHDANLIIDEGATYLIVRAPVVFTFKDRTVHQVYGGWVQRYEKATHQPVSDATWRGEKIVIEMQATGPSILNVSTVQL